MRASKKPAQAVFRPPTYGLWRYFLRRAAPGFSALARILRPFECIDGRDLGRDHLGSPMRLGPMRPDSRSRRLVIPAFSSPAPVDAQSNPSWIIQG